MVNEEEARRITARSYSWRLPNGEPAPTVAVEFDLGYIVLPDYPPPPPRLPGEPPEMSPPGTAAVVVDRQTGSATVLPFHGIEGTAELYRAERRHKDG
jgi:hypothetical protein